MKSICFLLLFAIFSIQCSTTKYTVEEKALIEKYQMPNFSSDEINRFALDYLKFYEEITQAAKSGNQSKVHELSLKSIDWAQRAADLTQKMTAKDAQKFVELAQKIALGSNQ